MNIFKKNWNTNDNDDYYEDNYAIHNGDYFDNDSYAIIMLMTKVLRQYLQYNILAVYNFPSVFQVLTDKAIGKL